MRLVIETGRMCTKGRKKERKEREGLIYDTYDIERRRFGVGI